jgi:hypothetical protein
MTQTQTEVYKDAWATFAYDQNKSILEFIWTEHTADMSDHDFEYSTLRYASFAKQYKVKGLLIDLRNFKFKPGPHAQKFHITFVDPVYNECGVQRKAFLMNQEPASQPPHIPAHNFETRNFGSYDATVNWLSGAV